jgi:uncharacterized protein (DUF1501 family)
MITRRVLLAGIGAGALPAFVLPGISVAFAALPTDRRLVVVVLRGALDGLAAVPPYADPDYRALRGALAFPEPGTGDGALDLDGRFGLHPSLKPLHAMYQRRELIVCHAVATPYRSRSHFDGQDVLENGATSAHGVKDGWLNRTLALYGGREKGAGLAVGQAVPLILRGDVPVSAWAPRTLPRVQDDFLVRLGALYRPDRLMGPAFAEVTRAQAMSDEVAQHDKLGDEKMGDGKQQLRGAKALPLLMGAVGELLADAKGPRIAALDATGWDTHANQGLLTGPLANNLAALAGALDSLRTGLGPVWDKTAVLVATEFGRTVRPNGTGGTDHGTAGVAFLLGGRVAGGRVVTRWPGLSEAALFEGRDLAPTTDILGVFKAALTDHLGLPEADVARRVFPDSPGAPRLREMFRA